MMNSKKVLFVLAHLDDEAFSMGTIKKLLERGVEVSILYVCGLGNSLSDNRVEISKQSAEYHKIKIYSLKYFDLTLSTLDHEIQQELKQTIKDFIYSMSPDTIITNNSDDLHSDHQFVSNMIRIITRPSQDHKIKKLYECYIPGANEYGEFNIRMFNTVVNIDSSYGELLLDRYDLPDIGMSNKNGYISSVNYFGALYGYKSAEIFKPIFIKE